MEFIPLSSQQCSVLFNLINTQYFFVEWKNQRAVLIKMMFRTVLHLDERLEEKSLFLFQIANERKPIWICIRTWIERFNNHYCKNLARPVYKYVFISFCSFFWLYSCLKSFSGISIILNIMLFFLQKLILDYFFMFKTPAAATQLEFTTGTWKAKLCSKAICHDYICGSHWINIFKAKKQP